LARRPPLIRSKDVSEETGSALTARGQFLGDRSLLPTARLDELPALRLARQVSGS